MKTLLSYLAVMMLILTSSFTVQQQQELNDHKSVTGCFNSFRVHRQGQAGVALAWSVSTKDIAQFVIERSYDGEFFENVNAMGFNGASIYRYADHGVYPGVIYYRIKAVKADGSEESSPVDVVRIVQRG